MRAKIMMLAGAESSLRYVHAAQELLTDLAVAFNHAFIMKEGRGGAVGSNNCTVGLNEELLAGAHEADSVLAVGIDGAELLQLIKNFKSVFRLTRVLAATGLMEASILKSGLQPQGFIASPCMPDQPKDEVFAAALMLAQKQALPFHLMAQDAASSNDTIRFPQALELMTAGNAQFGMIFADENTADDLRKSAQVLSGFKMSFDFYTSAESRGFYAVNSQNDEGFALFSILYAAVEMLKRSLNLHTEAECLKSVVDNMLISGWGKKDEGRAGEGFDVDDLVRLISEQIALVGELMNP